MENQVQMTLAQFFKGVFGSNESRQRIPKLLQYRRRPSAPPPPRSSSSGHKQVHILRGKVFGEEILTEEDDADEGVSHPLSVLKESNHNDTPPGSVSNPEPLAREQFGNNNEKVGSKGLEGIRLATATMEFKDVKNFKDFTIIVNGWNIDSELPEHVRAKYYELYCSQKAFLHDHLLPVVNCKMITGIIPGIVDVADFIRSCNLTTSENDFANCNKCLDAFERLGMNVGFLHARLHQLMRLSFLSKGAMYSKMCNEPVLEQASLVQETRNLEVKLME
ncbi:B3 domain-containing protein Os01g0234100-like [Macadamia integrifolia]|uniref:B3 domain-containing protein Os01g0234100-like n=1 Tax=Macadamia integrifolia TaxID=60698 RepID=UPI001C4FA07A|nr:B3 domain-containing protein Os01g0234100-like [Macadamia integrifolia]